MNHYNPSVLLVDDEPQLCEKLAKTVAGAGFPYLTACNVTDAQRLLCDHDEIGIVVTDLHMSGRSGLRLLESEPPPISLERRREFVVMTGRVDKAEAIRALRLGVLDFLEKPFAADLLLDAVGRAVEVLRSRAQHRLLRDGLREDMAQQSELIALLRDELSHAYAEPLHCLCEASFQRDHETGSHTRRMGMYARFLARALGWSPLDEARIDLAARLHDVGKIGIPDSILRKQAALTADEWLVMKRHTEIGEAILARNSASRDLKLAADIAGGHHEHWDGTGYPRGLAGDAIPLAARITQIGDVYDALRSPRPYKRHLNHTQAMDVLLNGDGRTRPEHFDPRLLNVLERQQYLFATVFDHLRDER
jgi:putative two-component system response regulator